MSAGIVRRLITRTASIMVPIVLAGPCAAQTMYGPTPYLCSSDSPFATGTYLYFYNETFEDHLMDTPGLSASDGGVTSVVFGPSIHDSVDCDDGVLDGSGLDGDSYFANASSITFIFAADVLGSLPSHAGLVWTDAGGGDVVTLRAYDANNTLVGTRVGSGFADGSNVGQTAEDRFFGVYYEPGVKKITISHTSGGLEVDHVQYGRRRPSCPADFNGDGFLDGFDYDDFVNCFETGSCPPGANADFNGDGFADGFDYDDYVTAFEAGC